MIQYQDKLIGITQNSVEGIYTIQFLVASFVFKNCRRASLKHRDCSSWGAVLCRGTSWNVRTNPSLWMHNEEHFSKCRHYWTCASGLVIYVVHTLQEVTNEISNDKNVRFSFKASQTMPIETFSLQRLKFGRATASSSTGDFETLTSRNLESHGTSTRTGHPYTSPVDLIFFCFYCTHFL